MSSSFAENRLIRGSSENLKKPTALLNSLRASLGFCLTSIVQPPWCSCRSVLMKIYSYCACVDLPSQNLTKNKSLVTRWPAHQHTNRPMIATVAEGRTDCPESAVSRYCSHQHTDTERKTVAETNKPQMRVGDKGVLCSKPHASAQTAVRTMMLRQLGPTSTSLGLLALTLTATDVAVMFPSRSDVSHLSIWSDVKLVLFTARFSHRQFSVFIHD